MAGLRRPALRIVNRDGSSGPIDKQLLAGLVFLAQHYIQLADPTLIQFAETAVAVSFRVGLLVLFPEQLQSDVPMLLLLFAQCGKVRRRFRGIHCAFLRAAEES